MKQLTHAALAITTASFLALSAFGQQPNAGFNQPMQGMQMSGGNMSGNGMMQGCQKGMKSMMNNNSKTTKDIEAAKASNDPTKMRAALDEAEKALSPMNEHMNRCMSMMDMMDGNGGMMNGKQNQPKPQSQP